MGQVSRQPRRPSGRRNLRAPGSADTARLGIALPQAHIGRPRVLQGSVEELVDSLYDYPTGHQRPYANLFSAGQFTAAHGWWKDSVRLLDWPATHSTVAVFFNANWIAGRSAGTCYLALPSLTGVVTHNAAVAAASDIGEGPRHNIIAAGISSTLSANPVVSARSVIGDAAGVVDVASSTPAPNVLESADHVGWECTRTSRGAGQYGFDEGSFQTYSDGQVVPGPAPVSGQPVGRPADCSAVAVIDAGSDIRDGQLLFAGVLLPLAVGLILVDGMLLSIRAALARAFTRRQRAAPPAPPGGPA